jgi:hypothetical protein
MPTSNTATDDTTPLAIPSVPVVYAGVKCVGSGQLGYWSYSNAEGS